MPIKSSLRKKFLELRAALDAKQHNAGSIGCSRQIHAYIDGLKRAQPSVAGYCPIRSELDALSALHAIKNIAITALPVVVKDKTELIFRHFITGDMLVEGTHGIPIPSEEAPLVIPDILIVPLLAFDRKGGRLGYGAGHYDATLRGLRAKKQVLAIGAAFAMQESRKLPTEPHDEPLDVIITEKEIILANKKSIP